MLWLSSHSVHLALNVGTWDTATLGGPKPYLTFSFLFKNSFVHCVFSSLERTLELLVTPRGPSPSCPPGETLGSALGDSRPKAKLFVERPEV